jgi:hypothetical protein
MFRGSAKNDEGKTEYRLSFMTEEETRMVDNFLTKIEQNRSYMDEYYARWEKEQEAYAGDQPIEENRPNTRVNIINANVEGQVAAIVENNIAVSCRGEGPSDQPFARWAQIGLDWTLRKNHIKRLLERHERRRGLFGAVWFKVYWDPDAIDGFGLATITCPPLTSVFVDMKINDPMRLQEAEYIAEVMLKSKTWAKQEYGDIADHIFYGGSDRSPIFTKEKTTDDEDAFWLVQLWTKTDGMLRLIEFSEDGVLLYDSFKEWDGKRFVEKKEKRSFYRRNMYPYFLTIMYPEEGKLFGFGDGKLLRSLQDMLNDLYDQIRRAARPNRIFFDETSEVDLEDLDADDGPVPCRDPNRTIRIVELGKVNPALWQLIKAVHEETQRVTRFSELMMGQKTMAKTATEAAIQQQQGNSATDHKKLILEETLTEVCEYLLDLMMENYTGGKFFRIDENKEDYEWVDFRQMLNVPVLIPAGDGFIEEFRRNNPETPLPKWQQLKDESGVPVTKSVDLDIEINLGAGLPKNKAFLYQMFLALSKAVIEGKNAVTWQEFRKFAKDFLGLPLEENPEALAQPQVQQQIQPQIQLGSPGITMNAQAEGLSTSGAPLTGTLPTREVIPWPPSGRAM